MVLDEVVGDRRPARTDVWVPDGLDGPAALARTTVLGVGAHPDDLELGAVWGPVSCAGRGGGWFTGVVCTDGAGTPARPPAGEAGSGVVARRRAEQRRAAALGGYSAMVQLGHASAEVRSAPGREELIEELALLLAATEPEVVLTHDPLDRHPTHVAVATATVAACRRSASDRRPRLLGVEGWRPLGGLAAADLVRLDVSEHGALARDLAACHASELAVARYDLAAEGRRRANSTFADPHRRAGDDQVVLAVDLTAATHDGGPTLEALVADLLRRAATEVLLGLDPLR